MLRRTPLPGGIGLCESSPSLHARILALQLTVVIPSALLLLLADDRAFHAARSLRLFLLIGSWAVPPLATNLQGWGLLYAGLVVWLAVGLWRARHGHGNVRVLRTACVYGSMLYAAACASQVASLAGGYVGATGVTALSNCGFALWFLIMGREPAFNPSRPTWCCRWLHRHPRAAVAE